jgi:hypothetical protein
VTVQASGAGEGVGGAEGRPPAAVPGTALAAGGGEEAGGAAQPLPTRSAAASAGKERIPLL